MNLNHIHLGVRDLTAALDWLDRVWQVKSQFQNDRMAAVVFGAFTLILDAAETDSSATVGFESDNCDRDYRTLLGRDGPESSDQRAVGRPLRIHSGPGGLRFEIEGPTS